MQHIAKRLHEALEHGVRDCRRQVAHIELAVVRQVVSRPGPRPAAAHPGASPV